MSIRISMIKIKITTNKIKMEIDLTLKVSSVYQAIFYNKSNYNNNGNNNLNNNINNIRKFNNSNINNINNTYQMILTINSIHELTNH